MTDDIPDFGPPIEGPQPGVLTVDELRHAAYIAPGGPDSIYMKWQRGEATEQDWLDSVAAVKALYPDPEPETPAEEPGEGDTPEEPPTDPEPEGDGA